MVDVKFSCANVYIVNLGEHSLFSVTEAIRVAWGLSQEQAFNIGCELDELTHHGKREAVVFQNVTVGLAYEFRHWINAKFPGIQVTSIDAGMMEWNNTLDRQILAPELISDQEFLKLRSEAEEFENAALQLRELVQNHEYQMRKDKKAIQELDADNRLLRNANVRLERAMMAKFNDVRVDPNDPNTYIVRPSARTEARLLGELSDDVVTVVWQILKPKTVARLRRKSPRHNKFDGCLNMNSLVGQNGLLARAFRQAAKPNTRGATNATRRMIGHLSMYSYEFWKHESAEVRAANVRSGKHLKNSKFNW